MAQDSIVAPEYSLAVLQFIDYYTERRISQLAGNRSLTIGLSNSMYFELAKSWCYDYRVISRVNG